VNAILFLRIVVLLLAASIAVDAAGAAKPIDADGPDFVESSEVVGKGRFQFEADVVSERDRRNSTHVTTTSTPTLLRFGVADTIEFRIETEGWMRVTGDNAGGGVRSTATGSGDIALGGKWHSQDRDSSTNTPAVSWILHFEVPTGSSEFRGRGITPSLRSVITWDLPHDLALDLALGLMPGVKYGTAPDGHRFVSGIVGLVLNKQWTQTLRSFVENSSSQIARSSDGGVVMTWDAGAAYQVTDDWQIGFRAGFAANRNSPKSQMLVELAGRF